MRSISPRTRAQLAQAMHRGGGPDEAAEAVLNRFTDAGLIDDAAFARAWVESRHHSRGLSKRSLSAELRRHGVDNDEIREAVDVLDPEQEVATARRLGAVVSGYDIRAAVKEQIESLGARFVVLQMESAAEEKGWG